MYPVNASGKHHERCLEIINRETVFYNKRGNAQKMKGKVRLNAEQKRDSARSERILCSFGPPTTVEDMGYCLKNVRSLVQTGQRSEQQILSSPTLATRRKPVMAIAVDRMTVQRWTVLFREAGSYQELYSMVQNKMATAKLGFELCALTTIPERADVGDGPGGERGTSETLPKPFRRR